MSGTVSGTTKTLWFQTLYDGTTEKVSVFGPSPKETFVIGGMDTGQRQWVLDNDPILSENEFGHLAIANEGFAPPADPGLVGTFTSPSGYTAKYYEWGTVQVPADYQIPPQFASHTPAGSQTNQNTTLGISPGDPNPPPSSLGPLVGTTPLIPDPTPDLPAGMSPTATTPTDTKETVKAKAADEFSKGVYQDAALAILKESPTTLTQKIGGLLNVVGQGVEAFFNTFKVGNDAAVVVHDIAFLDEGGLGQLGPNVTTLLTDIGKTAADMIPIVGSVYIEEAAILTKGLISSVGPPLTEALTQWVGSQVQHAINGANNPGAESPTAAIPNPANPVVPAPSADPAVSASSLFISAPPPSGRYIQADGTLAGSPAPMDNPQASNLEIVTRIAADGSYAVTAQTIGADIANAYVSDWKTGSIGFAETFKLVSDMDAWAYDPNQLATIAATIGTALGGTDQQGGADIAALFTKQFAAAPPGTDPLHQTVTKYVFSNPAGLGSPTEYLDNRATGMTPADALAGTIIASDTIGFMTQLASNMTFLKAVSSAVSANGSHYVSDAPATPQGSAYLHALSDGYVLEQAAYKIDAGLSPAEEAANFKAIAAAASEYSQPSEFLGAAYLAGLAGTPALTLPLNSAGISAFIQSGDQANPGAATAIGALNASAGLFMQDYRNALAAGASTDTAVDVTVSHAFA